MSRSDLKVCALDTETHLIEPGKLAPRLVCVSYCDGEKTGLLHREDLNGQIKEFLDLRSYLIVGHNIAYDMAVLAQNDPSLIPHIFTAYNESRIEDTQIREQLIDIARGNYRGVYRDADNKKHKREYSLSAIAKRRLKIEMEKEEKKKEKLEADLYYNYSEKNSAGKKKKYLNFIYPIITILKFTILILKHKKIF